MDLGSQQREYLIHLKNTYWVLLGVQYSIVITVNDNPTS